MTTWGAVAAAEPELAAFVAERLRATPPYLATVQANGAPRIHPVTPIFTADGEASVSGTGHPVEDAAVRATVVTAASYSPADREGGPAQQVETR